MKNGVSFSQSSFFDLHVHSHYSYDCKSSPKTILKVAEKKELDGLAITDHNTVDFHKRTSFETKLLIIPGIEISTKSGHVIALGIDQQITNNLSLDETIEKINELSGEVIIPHPFDFTRKGIGKKIQNLTGIAVETKNASCPLSYFNKKAKIYARNHSLAETGGSDSHRTQDIAMAYTICKDEINSIDDLLEAIRKKQTMSDGANLSIFAKLIRAFQIHF